MAKRQAARLLYQPSALEPRAERVPIRYAVTAIIPEQQTEPVTQKPIRLDDQEMLKQKIMGKYRGELTADMEVIYNADSGKQIGTNLSSLVDQVLRPHQHTTKSFDRDLFIFYTVKHKKISLSLLEKQNPEVRNIYNRMRAAMEQ
jgi:hypothetical protein